MVFHASYKKLIFVCIFSLVSFTMWCLYREEVNQDMQVPEYKVIVIGESMTGKSTFVHNMFYNRRRPGDPRCTVGVDVCSVDLDGVNDKKRAVFWDCAGNPAFAGLGEDYWKGATHALIFTRRGSQQYRYYINRLPRTINRKVIFDYDQEGEDFAERKAEIYEFLE